MFGFTYKSANKRSTAVINATQAVLSQVQIIGCQEIIPQMIYNIKNKPNDPRLQSPQELKSNLATEITNMTARLPGASKTNLNNSLTKLVNVVVDNSTVNGKIDQALVRQNMVDVLSSFCPGKMMGKFDPPPTPISTSLPKPVIVEEIKNDTEAPYTYDSTLQFVNKYTISYNFIIDITGKPLDPGTIVEFKISNDKEYTNVLLKGSDLKSGINTFTFKTGSLEGKTNIKINITPKGINRITIKKGSQVTLIPDVKSVTSAVKSAFMNISHFGSGGGGFIMFLLFLLIVAGILYYLHSQGKLKFPTMGQRIAQFGRDMRSIRGIRARR